MADHRGFIHWRSIKHVSDYLNTLQFSFGQCCLASHSKSSEHYIFSSSPFPLLSLLFSSPLFFSLCRPCTLIAVLMREVSRLRRRRITRTSCCWPHRLKSRRPARRPKPTKVSVCFNLLKKTCLHDLFMFLRDVPGCITYPRFTTYFTPLVLGRNPAESWESSAHFKKKLLKTPLMLCDQCENIIQSNTHYPL